MDNPGPASTGEGLAEAPAPAFASRRRAPSAAERAIVLLSDGTGNSSGKLFKTNVWRMYEAVDLGPSPAGQRDQIAYYDNGVGTTSFRPLRIAQGVFGWGLKRNVLEIYRYACRNYRPGKGQKPGPNPDRLGDSFYGFGFSRGAFTMRLAIDLIASQGIVTYEDERELERKTRAAYRAYCTGEKPPGLKALPTRGWRLLRNAVFAGMRRLLRIPPYDPSANYQPVIKFVGVWDTVAAYGGPIVEITRAIDNFLYPLSMPSYRLHPRVECARHALALDDERASFHPLLWDELNEAELAKEGRIIGDRLQQVWFTGMHADVGGGYPDESLSYVSLLWMLQEAEKAGLRTLDVVTERYLALANSFGPMHDSRAGVASYYRYQPRKIAALLEPVDTATIGMRDPAIRDPRGKRRGLIRDVKVHESVIARIANGTDFYAPVTIPGRFTVVPPGPRSEAEPQPVTGAGTATGPEEPAPVSHAVLHRVHRRRLEREGVKARLGRRLERCWDLVWIRRAVYFLTVFATLALLLLPAWGDSVIFPWEDDRSRLREALIPGDDREWLGNLILLSTALLPEFAHPWVEGLARSPWLLTKLVVLILALNWLGRRLERGLKERARQAWSEALGPHVPPTAVAPTRIERVRSSALYQGGLRFFKWYLLPTVIGLAMLLLFAWTALAVATQIRLPAIEAGETFCTSPGPAAPWSRRQVDFTTASTCHPTGMRVEADERYAITFEVGNEWRDGGHRTTPVGAGPFGIGWAGPFGVPMRRVVDARYLQPIAMIRDGTGGDRSVQIYALDMAVVPDTTNRWRAELSIPTDGELFLFANDAALPFDGWHDFFYRGAPGANQGDACVTIEGIGMLGEAPPPAPGSLCAKLASNAPASAAGSAKPRQRR